MQGTMSQVQCRPAAALQQRSASGQLRNGSSASSSAIARPQRRALGVFGWSREDIPSQEGKRIIVTGANSGIGLAVVKQLVAKGASEVVMVGRSMERLEEAAQGLRREHPGARLVLKQMDLQHFSSIKSFARDMLSTDAPIHLLVNMAGRFMDGPFEVTKDGMEVTMQTDFWGQAYLTLQLLQRIRETQGARIVNMSSELESCGSMDWSDLKGDNLGTGGLPAYGRAKLFMLMWTLELHSRLQELGDDTEVYAVHPGLVETGLWKKIDLRYPFAALSFVLRLFIGHTPDTGALSTLYAATEPGLPGGRYYGPQYVTNLFFARECRPLSNAARDPTARARLWEEAAKILAEVTGESEAALGLPAAGGAARQPAQAGWR